MTITRSWRKTWEKFEKKQQMDSYTLNEINAKMDQLMQGDTPKDAGPCKVEEYQPDQDA